MKHSAETDQRPWGYYTVLADETDHKVKRIIVYPGQRLSLQKHKQRAEHWFVLSGEGIVTLDGNRLKKKVVNQYKFYAVQSTVLKIRVQPI